MQAMPARVADENEIDAGGIGGPGAPARREMTMTIFPPRRLISYHFQAAGAARSQNA